MTTRNPTFRCPRGAPSLSCPRPVAAVTITLRRIPGKATGKAASLSPAPPEVHNLYASGFRDLRLVELDVKNLDPFTKAGGLARSVAGCVCAPVPGAS